MHVHYTEDLFVRHGFCISGTEVHIDNTKQMDDGHEMMCKDCRDMTLCRTLLLLTSFECTSLCSGEQLRHCPIQTRYCNTDLGMYLVDIEK